jgi:hypothetical protein
MPFPIVVVPVTLGQIDAVVVAGLVAALAPVEPVLEEPVPAPDPPDMPGMPGLEPEPPVVDVLAPCDGAATALLPAASVNDVAPRTSTAATASEDAVPHHIRPAVPMAFHRARTFIMTFRMTTSFSLGRSVNPRCHGAVRRMLGICGSTGVNNYSGLSRSLTIS